MTKEQLATTVEALAEQVAAQSAEIARMREALKEAEWRIRHVEGDCEGCPDLPHMDQCALCIIRAALKEKP